MVRNYSRKNSSQNRNKSKRNSKRKIYRKKRGSFKLKGGIYLKNNMRHKYDVIHPLQHLVKGKLDDEFVIHLDSENINQIDYPDIFTQAFFNKYLDILNYSFEKEREYSISQGAYIPGFKHNLESIKSNIHSPNFHTYILTSSNLTPISFLYVERKDDSINYGRDNRNGNNHESMIERDINPGDYDKIWTVCTDPEYRGKGKSSKLMNHVTIDQLNNNRSQMLLEVFNDHVISREENDVKQSQIMNHFGNNGFVHIPLEELSEMAQSNVIHPTGNTKIMIFRPDKWYENNQEQGRNLNHQAKQLCMN